MSTKTLQNLIDELNLDPSYGALTVSENPLPGSFPNHADWEQFMIKYEVTQGAGLAPGHLFINVKNRGQADEEAYFYERPQRTRKELELKYAKGIEKLNDLVPLLNFEVLHIRTDRNKATVQCFVPADPAWDKTTLGQGVFKLYEITIINADLTTKNSFAICEVTSHGLSLPYVQKANVKE